MSNHPKLGEGKGQRRDSLVSRVRSLSRETHREVAKKELVVPTQWVLEENRPPPQASGRDGPDGVASAAEGGYSWSVKSRQANDKMIDRQVSHVSNLVGVVGWVTTLFFVIFAVVSCLVA